MGRRIVAPISSLFRRIADENASDRARSEFVRRRCRGVGIAATAKDTEVIIRRWNTSGIEDWIVDWIVESLDTM
jgi:hypothetical protein